MYEYLYCSYSIFIHKFKNMSSELKYSLSSLSPLDDELKPSLSTTGCFRLFGRADILLLTGRQRPSSSIQPCSMGMGCYIPRGVTECMKDNLFVPSNYQGRHYQDTV